MKTNLQRFNEAFDAYMAAGLSEIQAIDAAPDDVSDPYADLPTTRCYVSTDAQGNILSVTPMNAKIVRRDDGFYDLA